MAKPPSPPLRDKNNTKRHTRKGKAKHCASAGWKPEVATGALMTLGGVLVCDCSHFCVLIWPSICAKGWLWYSELQDEYWPDGDFTRT